MESSGLPLSLLLLAAELSPGHWLYWESGFAPLKPVDLGSVVPGAKPAASPSQQDACFNIQLSHSEK